MTSAQRTQKRRQLNGNYERDKNKSWELWRQNDLFSQFVFFYDEKDLKKTMLKSQRSAILSNFLLFGKDYYFFIVYIKITIYMHSITPFN